jgi:hypothetical protein
MMNVLAELANKYSTDKQISEHGYVEFYDKLMVAKRESATDILEIGIGKGSSIRMWLDYFPNAIIHAVDHSSTNIHFLMSQDFPGKKRVDIIHADQTVKSLWDVIPNKLDFVIDDGSHIPEDQIVTFSNGFSKVKSKGLWIIEDTHCNFHEQFNLSGEDILYKWVYSYITNQQLMNIMDGNFYKARQMGATPDTLRWMIYSVQFFKSVIIFEKAYNGVEA